MKGYIFIDGGNVFHSVKEYNNANKCDIRIDFKKLADFLLHTSKIGTHLRTYYYTGVPVNVGQKQVDFLTKLNCTDNFEVKKKTLKIKNGLLIEKGVDVQIATDMMWCGLNKQCEHVILVSGDEDLTDAVVRLKEVGIIVTVAGFKNNVSKKILQSADKYIDLGQHIDKFSLPTRSPSLTVP